MKPLQVAHTVPPAELLEKARFGARLARELAGPQTHFVITLRDPAAGENSHDRVFGISSYTEPTRCLVAHSANMLGAAIKNVELMHTASEIADRIAEATALQTVVVLQRGFDTEIGLSQTAFSEFSTLVGELLDYWEGMQDCSPIIMIPREPEAGQA